MTPYSTTQLLAALDDALAVADQRGGAFSVCFVDDGGHVLLHVRQPAATIGAADSALSKARTAVWLGSDTGALPPTAPVIPALVAGVPWPLAVFPGGLVLRHGGAVAGAVGVGGSVDPADDAAVAAAAYARLESR
ncbi:heme-binding protein [Micromonospora sp. R77]|uniref:heme-binding protein n=1 Tax=Micromonospora sp. R77 TaxID=2925836 RepID=UPI001F600963|nr:heme-binding protein [Micromonospora sp. R77]MCI4066647.1 heme-binding protein [Micromonospora sp. R77]